MKTKLFFIFIMSLLFSASCTHAKTLVVYYSFTNNVHSIVSDLRTQIDADVVRIEPADKGIDYAANDYAAGSALIAAIRNHPDDADSYPAIDPVEVNLADYDMVIVAAPLWWSQMAAPLQTFLFEHGKEMAGKHIGLIVSSASSGISGVVADAKRLIPEGIFLEPNLWIRSSQTTSCHSLTEQWLEDIHYDTVASTPTAVCEVAKVTGVYHVSGQMMPPQGATKGISIVQYKSGARTYAKKMMNKTNGKRGTGR